MRSLMFKEGIKGPAVEKCVILIRSRGSKASDAAGRCCKNACVLKTCKNLTVAGGKDPESAERHSRSGLGLPSLWQSCGSFAPAACSAIPPGRNRSGQTLQRK